jgi:hypothetical protein
MRNRPRLPAAACIVAVVVAALLLTACGGGAAQSHPASQRPGSPPAGSERSVAATIAAMRAAVRAARSVHLTGTLSGTGGKTVSLDVGLIRSGGFSGTVTQGGVPQTIINAGGTVYVKATRAFLSELNVSAAVCAVMCGKYVAMSSAKGNALAGELSMPGMLRPFTGSLPAFTSAGTKTINGRSAQVLHGADGSTLAVAATGIPYPVQVISPRGAHGRLSFSQWNSVPAPVAPPASKVIDLSRLLG